MNILEERHDHRAAIFIIAVLVCLIVGLVGFGIWYGSWHGYTYVTGTVIARSHTEQTYSHTTINGETREIIIPEKYLTTAEYSGGTVTSSSIEIYNNYNIGDTVKIKISYSIIDDKYVIDDVAIQYFYEREVGQSYGNGNLFKRVL